MSARRLQIATAIVQGVLDALPEHLKAHADEVQVIFQDLATDDLGPPDLLGLYEGNLGDRDAHPVAERIYIFVEAIAVYCEDYGLDFADEVERTFLHELGHFFGWNEDQIAAQDLD